MCDSTFTQLLHCDSNSSAAPEELREKVTPTKKDLVVLLPAVFSFSVLGRMCAFFLRVNSEEVGGAAVAYSYYEGRLFDPAQ